jgi:hypothetical protein
VLGGIGETLRADEIGGRRDRRRQPFDAGADLDRERKAPRELV